MGAHVMRQKGALTMRLQDLADHLGVAYTALYHYFPSRDHLVEGILLWVIEQRREAFRRASGESALDRLLDFIYCYLTEDLEHKVRFPYLGGFPAPHRKALDKARRAVMRDIVNLIAQGITEGSIRQCHAVTIGHVVMSYLDRFANLDDELSAELRTRDTGSVVREMTDVLRSGLLYERVALETPSYDMPAPEELVGASRGLNEEFDRYEDIMRAATAAFNAHGAAASIPKIAAGLGVSKTVLYHYAVDKQDLLAQVYLRCVRAVEASHRVARDFGQSPVDEILIHRNNLFRFHSSVAGPFTLLNAMNYLRPQQHRLVRVRNQGVRAMSEQRLSRAIDAGFVRREVHPAVVQPVIAQVLYGLPAWYRHNYPITIMQVVQETGALLFKGLKA